MITEQYTELSPAQRAALETLLAEQLPGCASSAPANTPTWSVEDILDLEERGLLEYDPQVGTRVTAAGAQLVADLVYDAAAAEYAARRASTGRHALPDGAESTLPSLGIVISSRTDETEVIPAVGGEPVCTCTPEWCYVGDDVPDTALASECRVCVWRSEADGCPARIESEEAALLAEPEWPPASGDLDPFTAPVDFLGSFAEAAVEHTADLQAIAVDGWFRRAVSWVRVNTTPVRAAFAAATGGAFFGSLVTWAVTR